MVVRGSPADTGARSRRLVAGLEADQVLWVSEEDAPDGLTATRPSKVRRLLGRAYDAVVLDVHRGLQPDVLGQCHGFVWGGGALVLRLPPDGEAPPADPKLAVYPYGVDAVGRRFWRHFERALARAQTCEPAALAPAARRGRGTAEQAAVVDALAGVLGADTPARITLLADRGRGKSSALGLALARLDAARLDARCRVAVCAGHRDQAAEVFRFAGDGARFVDLTELVLGDEDFDVIVVDEAAQLPVPMLERLVERHARARIAFATTTHGYEGTGRGFSLRFVEWLERRACPLHKLELREPIRWAPDDPVEAFVFDALLLNAVPAYDGAEAVAPNDVAVHLNRDALVADEALLREFVGLLVQAHYRTTPGDVHRMLDAPNLDLHAILCDGHVVAATLVAQEGGLSPEMCEELYWGRGSIRGHALAETLVSHMGYREAGELRMRRSVRIATHPGLRRRGLASQLVEHVHACYEPDLFGTLFGATAELVAFRRSVGYELARVSSSRGSRTGEPSAMMLHPVSRAARSLLAGVRADLARDLPLQLELMQAGHDLLLDPATQAAVLAELPAASPRDKADIERIVRGYAFGPRTFESVAGPVSQFVAEHADLVDELDAPDRALIDARIRQRQSWAQTVDLAGCASMRAAMRGLRRAIRALAEHLDAPNGSPQNDARPL